MTAALLSLGGNVGDRKAAMDAAVAAIAALPGTTVTARSPYYRTAPDGPVAQDWFVNLAVAVATEMDAVALTSACKRIEATLGRDRSREIPWGPRTVDIDVVASGAAEAMTAPGGDFDTRPFVVIPLAAIAPDVTINGRSLRDHAARADAAGVERLDWPVPAFPGIPARKV